MLQALYNEFIHIKAPCSFSESMKRNWTIKSLKHLAKVAWLWTDSVFNFSKLSKPTSKLELFKVGRFLGHCANISDNQNLNHKNMILDHMHNENEYYLLTLTHMTMNSPQEIQDHGEWLLSNKCMSRKHWTQNSSIFYVHLCFLL